MLKSGNVPKGTLVLTFKCRTGINDVRRAARQVKSRADQANPVYQTQNPPVQGLQTAKALIQAQVLIRALHLAPELEKTGESERAVGVVPFPLKRSWMKIGDLGDEMYCLWNGYAISIPHILSRLFSHSLLAPSRRTTRTLFYWDGNLLAIVTRVQQKACLSPCMGYSNFNAL